MFFISKVFKGWKKVPFGKACQDQEKFPKKSELVSEGKCVRFPLGCNSLELRRAEFVRNFSREVSLRKWQAYLWSSK